MAKKQKKKPGKVVRLDQDSWNYVESVRTGRERLSDLIRRLIGLTPKGEPLEEPKEMYTIPSCVWETKEEATGEALYKSVKEKTEIEPVLAVRKIHGKN